MNNATAAQPDHNSLGKGAFITGLIALVMACIPIIGFVAWILAPIAIICGGIALRHQPRGLAIAGIVSGAIALLICFWWVSAAQSVSQALNKDTFNRTGESTDLSNAPIMDAKITGLWKEIEDNKVAAGTKYGGHRLRFTNEKIIDFQGDAASPGMTFKGSQDQFLVYYVSTSFVSADGAKIAQLKKGESVSFLCDKIQESFTEGYNLSGCKLQ